MMMPFAALFEVCSSEQQTQCCWIHCETCNRSGLMIDQQGAGSEFEIMDSLLAWSRCA